MIETTARSALIRWMAQDPRRTPTWLVRALGLRQTSSLRKWVLGVARPETHLRQALELVTNGRVKTDAWLLREERAVLRRLREPHARACTLRRAAGM